MIKIPSEIQVRIIRPQPEDSIPHIAENDIIEPLNENHFKQIIKKILSGGGVGMLLGLGIFLALKICGVNFGDLETYIILGIPFTLGIITSYVIF